MGIAKGKENVESQSSSAMADAFRQFVLARLPQGLVDKLEVELKDKGFPNQRPPQPRAAAAGVGAVEPVDESLIGRVQTARTGNVVMPDAPMSRMSQ